MSNPRNSVDFEQSETEFERARQLMPGGVNSPARAYASVPGPPPFIERAEGPWLEDVDGNRYVDFVGSWGPMLFGHNPPEIMDAVIEQLKKGMSFGAPTRLESEMAEQIRELVPSMELVRMVNSGTEATLSAVRLMRGATDRDYILKFEGCYHGHVDSLLVKAGSGGATLGQPDSAGIPEDLARYTLTAPFGDREAVHEAFEQYGTEIAGVILEPFPGNMGLIEPPDGFLDDLREITKSHGSLLVFDEVMTGFRVARGGVQSLVEVNPDLTALGKIIGGGMPVGAYGGREDVMREVSPDGPVYQAGTLSGNPVAMRAGLETLRKITRGDPYSVLEKAVDSVETAFREGASEAGVPLRFHRRGGMFAYFFTDREVVDYDSASSSDDELFARFHEALLQHHLYFPPSYYESCFVSTRHQGSVLERACEGIRQAFREL